MEKILWEASGRKMYDDDRILEVVDLNLAWIIRSSLDLFVNSPISQIVSETYVTSDQEGKQFQNKTSQ